MSLQLNSSLEASDHFIIILDMYKKNLKLNKNLRNQPNTKILKQNNTNKYLEKHYKSRMQIIKKYKF